MTLFAELKRRNVIRMGGLYLVGAWLLVQVAGTLLPLFGAPAWTMKTLVIVLALLFVPALVFAWVFELTPEGIKRDEEVPLEQSIASQTAQRMNRLIVALLVLAVVYFGFDKFVLAPKRDAALVASTAQTVKAQTLAVAKAAVSEASIAVLPFANMSGAADQDYFSDGMTEELLNVLAGVPQLKVVARTSVFEFKNKGGDVRQIGRKLGVSHIVEGSVRRDGEKVRITAQLLRVSDGFNVWSETYDRKLDSVFVLQDEIAQRIAEALKVSLGVDEPLAARASIDPQAYDEYLKGRAWLRWRVDLPGAIGHLRAAVAKAPDFAPGWSSLSLACEVRFWYGTMTPAEQAEMVACAAEAATRAAALAPDSAATEHALANVARTRFRFAEAERHYLRAMQIDDGYSHVREDYSEMLYQVGRVQDSAEAARQVVAMDPYFIVGWTRMRDAAVMLDRRADLEEAARQGRAITPQGRFGRIAPLEYALAYGRADEARAALAKIEADGIKGLEYVRVLLPWALGDAGVDEDSVRAAIAGADPGAANPFLVARRDVDGYNAYNARAGVVIQAYYFANLNRSRPAGREMLRDPRVKAKLVEYGFVDYWREKGWPAVCQPLGKDDFQCAAASGVN